MSDKDRASHLAALGSGNAGFDKKDIFSEPNAAILEKFKNPFPWERSDVVGTVHIEVPEFTSLCPLTGQPDFAKIIIDYQPREWCVESKSIKLYMAGFRNHGEFHESCIARMGKDLVNLLAPEQLTVKGEFTPRGGIPFHPTFQYFRNGI